MLVAARDLDLLLVLESLLNRVLWDREVLQFSVQFLFESRANLVAAFADNSNSLIDIAYLLGQFVEVPGDSGFRGFGLFVINQIVCLF